MSKFNALSWILPVMIFLAGLSLGAGQRGLSAIFFAISFVAYFFVNSKKSNNKIIDEEDENEVEDDLETPELKKTDFKENSKDPLQVLSKNHSRERWSTIHNDIVSALDRLLDVFISKVDFNSIVIFQHYSNGLRLFYFKSHSADSIQVLDSIKPGMGLVGNTIKNDGKCICEGDIFTSSTTLGYYSKNENISSFMGVPIKFKNHIRGSLVIDSKKKKAFSEEDKQNLEDLSYVVGNIMFFSYLQVENGLARDKVNALAECQKMFFQKENIQDIIETLGNILRVAFVANRITISLREEQQDTAKICFIDGIDRDEFKDYIFRINEDRIVSLVFQRGHIINRPFEDGRYVPRFSMKEKANFDIHSILAMPIHSSDGKEQIGVVALESIIDNRFDNSDIKNLTNLLSTASIALEKAKLIELQRKDAQIDGLTSLDNHRTFQNKLIRYYKIARRKKIPLGIILLDIDFFKNVNDTYGHPAGDKILKGISKILSGNTRKDLDVAARYGGEEFVCIVDGNLQVTLDTAERIRKNVESTEFLLDTGEIVNVTISAGIAMFPESAKDRETLIKNADNALYTAKHNGRNRVVTYGKN